MKWIVLLAGFTFFAPALSYAETTCHSGDVPTLEGVQAVSVIQRDCHKGDSILFRIPGLNCSGPRCTETMIPTLCTRPAAIQNYGLVVCIYRGR